MDVNRLCMGCMEDDSGEPICPKCGRPADLAPKNSLQLKPRTILRDQYLIGRTLGQGGFGITYLAWDVGLETRLAIKEYMPNGVAGRASGTTTVLAFSDQTKVEFDYGLDRFLDEARVLKKFRDHPGIVSIDTIFRDNGTAYLVMEYLDGMTFEEFLKRRDGKVTVETALRVILPVTDALAAVHAEGILHRDISPDNIHLSRNGKIKLIDFGAARNALGQKSRNLSIILKEGYAPEEQYRASGIQGPWTDVYATAATLYHAVTGQVPQPSLDRQADDQLQAPGKLGVVIEPNVEAALMKALSVKATDRFQSMEDFNAALTGKAAVGATRKVDRNDPRIRELEQSAMSQAGVPPPPPPRMPGPMSGVMPGVPIPGPAVPPPPPAAAVVAYASGRPRWMWPAALGGVALIAVVAVMLRNPIPTPPADNKDKQGATDGKGGSGAPQGGGQGDGQGGTQGGSQNGGQTGGGSSGGTQGGGQSDGGSTSGGSTSGGSTGGGSGKGGVDQGGQQGQGQGGGGGGVSDGRGSGGQGSNGGSQRGSGGGGQQGQGQGSSQGGGFGGDQARGGDSARGGGRGASGGVAEDGGGTARKEDGTSGDRSDTGGTGGRGSGAVPNTYEGLVQAATQAGQRNSFQQAEQLLSRAISMDPNRPQAYDKLGELDLYSLNQVGPAIQNYQAAIAHGGQATFHVAHDHSTGNFTTNCKGYLYVSKTQVHYKAFDSVHEFSASRGQIREMKSNRFTINLSKRAAVDLKAFHVKLADGRNFNLAPLSHFQEAERDLILSIGGNE